MRFVTFAVLGAVVLGACGHQRARPDFDALRYRAALDLRCSQSEIEVYPVGPRSKLVRACHQEAVYIHDCEVASSNYGSRETDCTWRLDRGPSPLR